MSTFSITINNNSNVARRFLLFQDMPAPTNGPSSTVFTNVYQRSPKIQSGDDSRVSFQMKQEYFAIYGTASESSDGSVRIYTSSSVPVKLGPGGTTVVVTTQDGEGNDPSWDKAAAVGQTTGAKGGFSIVTDTSFKFPNPNTIYIGCGARDPKSPQSIIPVQTYIAEPGLNSQLFPKVKYYICFGEYQPGMVVDRTTLGNVLSVDFTGCTIPNASFTLNSNGAYEANPAVEQAGIKWAFGKVPTS
ncbi:hypothetical protein GE09DRAFT_300493 [Coniochaeta sp. 2T2.1]|nr:hypothetical protein GE09DRAFT_300493 [Coniochaeta sp. 2T2.1]